MLNAMLENENTSFENTEKFVFLFSIIVFNMMKLLVILFIMKLFAQINMYKWSSNTEIKKYVCAVYGTKRLAPVDEVRLKLLLE